MRYIKFKEVGMKNYGPYIDPMVLSFEDNRLTMITGPNGIGKSMILDAIPFTLYGVTSKGARGDDVTNNKIGKNCHTWVKLQIIDDVANTTSNYTIDRYHNYTRLGNTVILKEEKEEKCKGHREVLPMIERLISPQKLFMNTILFGQQVKNFFTDITDSEKKEIFRKILNLDIYEIYYKEVTDQLKIEAESIQEVLSEIQLNNKLIAEATEQIEILEYDKADWELKKKEAITSYKSRIHELQNRKKLLEVSIGEVDKDELKKVQDKLAELRNEDIQISSQLKSLENDIEYKRQTKENELRDKMDEEKNRIEEKFNKEIEDVMLEKSKEEEKLRNKIKENDAEGTKINVKRLLLIGDKERLEEELLELDVDFDEYQECPTCLQEITDAAKQNIKNKVIADKRKLKEIEETISKYQEEIDNSIVIGNQLENQLNEIKETYNQTINSIKEEKFGKFTDLDLKFKSTLEQLQQYANQKIKETNESLLQKINEIWQQISQFLKQENQIQEKIKRIDDIKEEVYKINSDISVQEKLIEQKESDEFDITKIDRQNKKIEKLISSNKELDNSIKERTKRIEHLEFWKTGFSSTGIPSLLIDESIPFMNQQVSNYLDKISNGRYVVSFDTLQTTKAGEYRDKISVNVLDTHSQANSRVQLSGGQTRIVDIATILTLGKLQSKIQNSEYNLLLFDEIFDSLDDENISFVSKVLRQIAKEKHIVIISHRHIDEIDADEILALN